MTQRSVDRWIAGALALYAFGVAAGLVFAGMHPIGAGLSVTRWSQVRAALGSSCASLTYDDGFYYLRIAQNIARGWGSTFDGVNPTNGYQPLWLLSLVPVFWLASSPDAALILAVVLQCVLMSLGAGVAYRIARLECSRFWAGLAVLLWVHAQLPYRAALSGMEYGVNAFTIFAVIYVWRRFFLTEPRRARAHVGLGLLLALSFLARLDNLLLCGCIGVDLGRREVRRGLTQAGARRLAAFASPVVGTAIAYAAANVRLFGHVLPVSGVIKRDWSTRLLQADPVYRAHGWWIAKLWNLGWPLANTKHAFAFFLTLGSGGVVAAWTLALIARARATATMRDRFAGLTAPPASRDRLSRIPGALVFFSVAQVSAFCLVYHDGYSFQRWYFVIEPWLGAVLVAAIAETAWAYAARLRFVPTGTGALASALPIALASGVILASARTIRQWRDEAALGVSREPLYAAASWVQANVAPSASVGSWNAGTIAYLSARRVVNLDGLVNSWRFHETREADLCRYWREEGITYLVDTFEMDREVAFIEAYYSPGVDLAACAARLERVWVGPGYLDTSRHAEAFELRSSP